ncbi:sporulation NAD-dependent epimerase/dehydratase YfnG [Neobacillus bataviensis LMG 21833]|uniref:Sporulation NAD-dependent epimerase/dehydratase YfnG n=1 Tax=Neobacillus bataviensis LMG 21833 TaxID=1117379 RepID=K6DHN0_9BACI|nr:NAD-dependent epimerase/dehydratase family protein [Neobacillus bataviensis]EKN67603.1 sporulation NAD-dependent epimerase/dehydratase YfnG [Neobacillus bataviensis LMG 21833]
MVGLNTFWEHRNVFVTGCTGFVGRHLVQELLQKGAKVTGLVRNIHFSILQEESFKRMNLVNGSVEDLQVIKQSIEDFEIDTVFHVAAQADVGFATQNPVATFETNIRGTWNVLEACRQTSVKRVIVTSSEKAYGDQSPTPYIETLPLQGRYPFDVSKSCADLLTNTYFQTYQLPACIIRCGNLFGEGDLNFNRIIPYTIQSVLQNKVPEIRNDGTIVRDFFYIRDAVEAHLLAAEKLESRKLAGEAFNFGYENPQTILAVVERIINMLKSDLRPFIQHQVSHESKHPYLSAKKAKELLDWHPAFDLDTGLESTIAWYQKYFGIH